MNKQYRRYGLLHHVCFSINFYYVGSSLLFAQVSNFESETTQLAYNSTDNYRIIDVTGTVTDHKQESQSLQQILLYWVQLLVPVPMLKENTL